MMGKNREPRQPSTHDDTYKMTIPGGKTCGECRSFRRCAKLISAHREDRVCDWSPHRFVAADVIQTAQARVGEWVRTCFGTGHDRRERAMRLLEEAIELAQAEGIGEAEANRVVSYVYRKEIGKPDQEAAGVGVCLLAWAHAAERDLWPLIDREIDRIHSKAADHFRDCQNTKAAAGIGVHATSEAGDDA